MVRVMTALLLGMSALFGVSYDDYAKSQALSREAGKALSEQKLVAFIEKTRASIALDGDRERNEYAYELLERYYSDASEWKEEADVASAVIRDFKDKLDPRLHVHYFALGMALTRLNDFDGAASSYKNSYAINPVFRTGNNLAWILATVPEVKDRDLDYALKVIQASVAETQSRSPVEIDTMAAVYAAKSDFDNAVKFEAMALRLVLPEQGGDYKIRLLLYQNHRAYRHDMDLVNELQNLIPKSQKM